MTVSEMIAELAKHAPEKQVLFEWKEAPHCDCQHEGRYCYCSYEERQSDSNPTIDPWHSQVIIRIR